MSAMNCEEWKGTTETHCEGVESFLTRGIPNLIAKHPVLKSAFLCQESGSDGRFLVRLKFVRDLGQ